ncbi:hypothetical protein EDD52_10847 [Primorskyibacter sedentarius]|uniref:Uncharacterized protein n=1 Tax=Primorskyibacter sedentarius TaxID=745311 RepID=A0A4R3JCC3_9RHOB|nr:hypothetical protein [Primorskyibacter sedentarius]TCS62753.1 hypothetical protein EDD52_10847 [Primorskyibacter sedentarius]
MVEKPALICLDPAILPASAIADTDENGSYHFHVGQLGLTAIPGCLTAQKRRTLGDHNGVCDASVRRPSP